MPQIFDFKRLIQKYSVPFVVITESGSRNPETGIYEKGTPVEQPRSGAIVPYGRWKSFQEGGYTSMEDRMLFCREEVPLNAKIRYLDRLYTVDNDYDYTEYADFYSYRLKRVESFDRS